MVSFPESITDDDAVNSDHYRGIKFFVCTLVPYHLFPSLSVGVLREGPKTAPTRTATIPV